MSSSSSADADAATGLAVTGDLTPAPAARTSSGVGQWLTETTRPAFGQWSTWILLSFSVVLALTPIEFDTGPRTGTPATIFFWLPSSLLSSMAFYNVVRGVLLVATALWAVRVWIPVSCWATVFAFTLLWSLRMENLTNGAHIFNVTNMLLFVHAMWFHFYRHEIAAASRRGDFWSTPCYPRWVLLLCVFYLGWFHSMAGFTKIATSGLGWGDGVSLQLWVKLFGWEPSPFGQLILYDTRLTAWLQTGALVIECASVLCVLHRWLRYAVGLGLLGFYIGVLSTFVTFGFHFNAILVAWFLLPVDRWLGARV